ncbi:hypothetical protein O181_014586 [Austropuccinia psidii MF-1]|uniref:Uncharacterized protein n=1 Tax=Austropuccinia psidii MF-1 TaxID=1389203 RepID=A0A9Q3BYD6_9BASI|nr:hypothetical protein [Austropuccinia psidii MF-1]
MGTSTPYTEQRQRTLTRKVSISVEIPTPLNQEIPINTTPIVRISAKDYSLWLDGEDVERFIKKVGDISEIERKRGSDIAQQIAFWTKDEE